MRSTGLAAGYLGERVIDGIDIEVRSAEAVVIVGSNGAGKTTLFRAIAGLLSPMDGRVVLDGKDLTGRPAHRIARTGISYVPAERHLFPAMTLKSNLTLGAYPKRPDRATLDLVYDLFPRLHERQRQQAGTLSGGEQQMLAVGRALMARPQLLMLDEPTTGLAPKIAEVAFEAFGELKKQGVTLLIAEQQVPIALSVADRGYVLENGRIRLEGTADRARAEPGGSPSVPGRRMRAVILDGIVLGLAFGLLGVGMTLVYGLGGVINLAYGQIVVVAAIVASLLIEDGMATALAAPIGVLAAVGLSLLLDLTLLQPVYRQHGEERTLLGLLLTLGAAFVIVGLLNWRYPLGSLYINITGEPISIIGVPMSRGAIWSSVITLGVGALLLLLLGGTTFGRGTRSVIQDEIGARLVGINPSFVRAVVFALSGALAGVVAMTHSMGGPLTINMGLELTTFALIVAVVGGLGSVAGAFLAGLLLGVVNTLSANYIGQYITTVILLAAAALTILIRPRGLLGR